MMLTLREPSWFWQKGRAIINLPGAFLLIGQGKLWGIQYPVYFLAVLVIFTDFAMRNFRFFPAILLHRRE
jgi:ribose/xylose/arabinose/galactoside ABC-type transport system permease subunit